MKKVISFLRVEEWLTSKVTQMIGILLFFAYINKTEIKDLTLELTVYFLFVSMFLAISYVANDLSDIEVDKKAGKKKVIAEMPIWLVWFSLVVMFLIGNAPIIIFSSNRLLCSILVAATYFLGLSYSTLGIRFKEKGVFGLIECSIAQRCMPLLLIICLEDIETITAIYLSVWILICFLDGLRYILIHQAIDMDNDIKSGVKTFATQKRKNCKGFIVAMFVLVIILTCGVLLPLWMDMPIVLACICLVYAFLEFCIFMVLNVLAGKDWFVTFDSVPLEAFLNIFLPIIIGAFLIRSLGWPMIVYCVLIFIVCFKPLSVKINLASVFIKSKIGKH